MRNGCGEKFVSTISWKHWLSIWQKEWVSNSGYVCMWHTQHIFPTGAPLPVNWNNYRTIPTKPLLASCVLISSECMDWYDSIKFGSYDSSEAPSGVSCPLRTCRCCLGRWSLCTYKKVCPNIPIRRIIIIFCSLKSFFPTRWASQLIYAHLLLLLSRSLTYRYYCGLRLENQRPRRLEIVTENALWNEGIIKRKQQQQQQARRRQRQHWESFKKFLMDPRCLYQCKLFPFMPDTKTTTWKNNGENVEIMKVWCTWEKGEKSILLVYIKYTKKNWIQYCSYFRCLVFCCYYCCFLARKKSLIFQSLL